MGGGRAREPVTDALLRDGDAEAVRDPEAQPQVRTVARSAMGQGLGGRWHFGIGTTEPQTAAEERRSTNCALSGIRTHT